MSPQETGKDTVFVPGHWRVCQCGNCIHYMPYPEDQRKGVGLCMALPPQTLHVQGQIVGPDGHMGSNMMFVNPTVPQNKPACGLCIAMAKDEKPATDTD